MIHVELDPATKTATLRPEGELAEGDFAKVASELDPFIEAQGKLNGLVISTRDFPGWKSFGAMTAHFSFVKEHQKHVARVALVTDSVVGDLAEKLASHFVSAEIKHFPFGELEQARQWVTDDSTSDN